MNTRFLLMMLLAGTILEISLRLIGHFHRNYKPPLQRVIRFTPVIPLIPALMLLLSSLSANTSQLIWIGGHWVRSSALVIPFIFNITPSRLIALSVLLLISILELQKRGTEGVDDATFAIGRSIALFSVSLMILSGSMYQICFFSFIISLCMIFRIGRWFDSERDSSIVNLVTITIVLSDVFLLAGATWSALTFGTTDFHILFHVTGHQLSLPASHSSSWILLLFFLGVLIKVALLPFNSRPIWLATRDLEEYSSDFYSFRLPMLFCLLDLQPYLFNTKIFVSIAEITVMLSIGWAIFQMRRGQHWLCLIFARSQFSLSIILLLAFWGHQKESLFLWVITMISTRIISPDDIFKFSPVASSRWFFGLHLAIFSGCFPIGTFWAYLSVISQSIDTKDWLQCFTIISLQILGFLLFFRISEKLASRLPDFQSPDNTPIDSRNHWYSGLLLLVLSSITLVAALEFFGITPIDTAVNSPIHLFISMNHNLSLQIIGYASATFVLFVWGLNFIRNRGRLREKSIPMPASLRLYRAQSRWIDSGISFSIIGPLFALGRLCWTFDRLIFKLIPDTSALVIYRGSLILGEFDRWCHQYIIHRSIPTTLNWCASIIETITTDRNNKYFLITCLFVGLSVLFLYFLLSEGF